MNINSLVKIVFVAILCFMAMAFACNDSGGGSSGKSNECDVKYGDQRPTYCRVAVDVPLSGTPSINDYVLKTPKGILVRSVVNVPPEALAAVDQAFDAVISHTRAIFPNWQAYSNAQDNQVVLVAPDHYSVEADPGAGLLNVNYTAGGDSHAPDRKQVSSADTCYGCPGFFNPDIAKNAVYLMAVVPHQANVDPLHPNDTPWSHLRFFRESIYNSFEHVQECGNTSDVCLQFAVAGDVHPHWGADIWSDPLPVIPAQAKRSSKSNRSGDACSTTQICKPLSLMPIPQAQEANGNTNRPAPNKELK